MSESAESIEELLDEMDSEAALRHLSTSPEISDLDGLLDWAGRRAQSDIDVAHAALDLCERLAPQRNRSDIVPQVSYIRARMALNKGDPERALRLIDQARQGWLDLDRPLDAYRTDLGRMHVLDDLGRHRDAAQAGVHLLSCLDELEPERTGRHGTPGDREEGDQVDMIGWLRAAVEENLGAAYGYLGQHDKAMASYDRAEAEYRALGDAADVARCRANRGVELVAQGHALDGLDAVSAAAEMFADIGDVHSYAKCLGHWADAELLLGRYNECLSRFVEARALFERLDARTEAARLAIKTVQAYLSVNLIDEAIDVGQEVDEELSDLGLAHDLAEARWLLGIAYRRSGQTEAALVKLDEAIAGALASEDSPLRIRALTTRSQVLAETGRRDEAVETACEALAIADTGSWPSDEWHLRLHLSQLVDENEAALHLDVAQLLADELDLPHLRYGALLERGRHHRRRGELSQARAVFQEAVALVEDLRGLIRDEMVRTSFLEGRTAAHSELMMSLLAGDDSSAEQVEAFELAERSKARTLADMIAGGVLSRPNSHGPAVETSGLEADLDACYRALISGGAGMTRDRRQVVQRRATELEILLQRSRLEHRQARTTTLGLPSSGPVTTRPAVDEQVVEYQVAGESLVAFVWSGGELTVVTDFPSVAEIRVLVDAWIRQRERYQLAARLPGDAAGSLTSSANRALEDIWAEIFAPVSVHLTDRSELLIVPHGVLHAIPFHALPTPDGRAGERWTISLAPSYAIAHALRQRRARADRSLVIGVADEAAPAVEFEAGSVAAAVPNADLLLNADATKPNMRAALQQPRDVVHIACHGLHRSRNPLFSALKLADGWLTAYDVMPISLSDSLVVLSACESGRHDGDHMLSEPLGLARSFLAVGARAVVVSLWRAHDSATADLMSSFYQHLGAGASPAGALQQAQADVLPHHPHPAAWAPFTVHGGLSIKGTQ